MKINSGNPVRHTSITGPKHDSSALMAMGELSLMSPPISGEAMKNAILKGIADGDNKAASGEFKVVQQWVDKNGDKLSPEARKMFDVYASYAGRAQAAGHPGLSQAEMSRMQADMNRTLVSGNTGWVPPTHTEIPPGGIIRRDFDASAAAALGKLDKTPGMINGDEMMEAIKEGIQDPDGHGASSEFKQFMDWAKKNQSRLSPEAKQVLGIYQRHAVMAKLTGQEGIPAADYKRMIDQMKNVQDASVASTLGELDKTQGPINGDQMAAAIEKGVQDLDGKGATDELKQFMDWAKKNESRLSPEAKQTLAIYEKYGKAAQAKGQSGISIGDFKKMVAEMKNVKDASVTAALGGLDKTQGPINGDQMAAAIEKGVQDLDGKGATDEFKQFADWAKKNESRLSPEAKEVLATYEKYAKAAQAKGQSGISVADFQKMTAEMHAVKDASVSAALSQLDRGFGPINGDQMAAAIEQGVRDLDGKGATDEFKQFADWAKKNESRLSPEAKEVLATYEKYAKAAQAKGQSGISLGDFSRMVAEMKNVKDASVSAELSRLDRMPGPINGDQMAAAIERGVSDFDGKSATDEFKQFADWAKANPNKLSPEAKQVLGVYEKYAKAAQAKGQSGMALVDFKKMVAEMKNVKDASVSAALGELDKAKGPINGDQMAAAIEKGVRDLDGKAATDEFKQFADWAKKNESRLSPEAKQVLGVYEKYAKAAQAKGQSGISVADFKKMTAEMNAVKDASVSAALAQLDSQKGPINGDQMAAAIQKGMQRPGQQGGHRRVQAVRRLGQEEPEQAVARGQAGAGRLREVRQGGPGQGPERYLRGGLQEDDRGDARGEGRQRVGGPGAARQPEGPHQRGPDGGGHPEGHQRPGQQGGHRRVQAVRRLGQEEPEQAVARGQAGAGRLREVRQGGPGQGPERHLRGGLQEDDRGDERGEGRERQRGPGAARQPEGPHQRGPDGGGHPEGRAGPGRQGGHRRVQAVRRLGQEERVAPVARGQAGAGRLREVRQDGSGPRRVRHPAQRVQADGRRDEGRPGRRCDEGAGSTGPHAGPHQRGPAGGRHRAWRG